MYMTSNITVSNALFSAVMLNAMLHVVVMPEGSNVNAIENFYILLQHEILGERGC